MQQSTPITRKQQLCNKLLHQVQYLDNQYTNLNEAYPQVFPPDSKQFTQLHSIHEKLQKVQSLNLKLQKDQEKLKLEYIMLLKEKHTFVNKLKAIENLGENFDWDDQSGVLQKVKPLIQTAKKRLKQSRGNGTQKS